MQKVQKEKDLEMNEVSFSSGARIWGGGCFQLLFHDPAHN